MKNMHIFAGALLCISAPLFSMPQRTPPARPNIAAPNAHLAELEKIEQRFTDAFEALTRIMAAVPNSFSGSSKDLNEVSKIFTDFKALIDTMYKTKALSSDNATFRFFTKNLESYWNTLKSSAINIDDNMAQYRKKTESIVTKIAGAFKKMETKSKDQKAALISGFKQDKAIIEKTMQDIKGTFIGIQIQQGFDFVNKNPDFFEREILTITMLKNIAQNMLNYGEMVLKKLNQTVKL